MLPRNPRIGATFTQAQLDGLNILVRRGIYIDRGTAIREAVRLLLGAHGLRPFYPEAGGR